MQENMFQGGLILRIIPNQACLFIMEFRVEKTTKRQIQDHGLLRLTAAPGSLKMCWCNTPMYEKLAKC
jgi:hypothetical protein